MEIAHLEELASLENHYWWHVAKRRLVIGLLSSFSPPPGKLVEAGIGAGGNLQVFEKLGYEVSGFDLLPEAVEYAKSIGARVVQVHNSEEPWPLEAGSADVVVMLDVLEHTENPVTVLTNAREILRPGGSIVITVPAGQYLFGPWDQALGHKRRYSARLLRTQASSAGFRVDYLSHWNAFSLPPALLLRGLSRLRGKTGGAEFPRVPGWLNRLLIVAAGVERFVIRRIPMPLGLSLVGVLTR